MFCFVLFCFVHWFVDFLVGEGFKQKLVQKKAMEKEVHQKPWLFVVYRG